MPCILFGGLILLLFLVCPLEGKATTSVASSEHLHVESERYVVSLLPSERVESKENGPKFVFTVRDKRTQSETSIQMKNRTDRVERLSIIDDALVIFGSISSYGMDVVTLFDLSNGTEKDSFLGYAVELSDTKRYLIYNQWHPRIAPAAAESSVILVYDLIASPQENRVDPKVQRAREADEVGHPIFPEENARKRIYRFWIEEEQDQHNVGPWRKYLWLDQDSKVVFVDKHAGEEWLVVVDLSQGLDKARIRQKAIDVARILSAKPGDLNYEALLKEGKERLTIEGLEHRDGRIIISVLPDIKYKTTQIEMALP